ncbi:MAG TPA: diguanylate cyclase [Herpetosiphonaceae bacterium]|nr:diguanylate cyclase [Herpetosiphonaceae bacterium]
MTHPRAPFRSPALAAYQILDTLPEQAYDDITRLAAQICGTSIAMLNFLPDERQWTKSQIGLDVADVALEVSFCVHAVEDPGNIMEIPDTEGDPRFAANPLVTGDPHLRFYAGAPLVTPGGHAIGAVCVLDTIPRSLSADQRDSLAALARQVMAQLELRRTAAALQATEARFRLFMDHSPALAFLKDTAGQYQYVNQAFLRRFDLRADEILGQDDSALCPPDVAATIRADDVRVMRTGQTLSSEDLVPTLDGQTQTWQVYRFAVPMAEEAWLGGMALDITVQKQYARYLETIQQRLEGEVQDLRVVSRTDGLTGLANRRAFDGGLARQIQQAAQSGQPLAVVMVDVDSFKSYNDTYGHPAGDAVLRQVAQHLAAAARGADLVARYGGEEFVLLLPNTSLAQATRVAERCRASVAAAAWPGRPVTISAGVAATPEGAPDPVALVAAADQAVYQAKRQGRNQVVTGVPQQ